MMQYDNNDMDKKLRQLENQSLPDLSKMDEHWAQFKAGLVPATQTGNNGGLLRKPWFYVIAAAVVGIVAVLFFTYPFHKKTEPLTIIPVIPVDTPRLIVVPGEIKVSAPVIKVNTPVTEIKKNTIKIMPAPLPILIQAKDTVQPVLSSPPAKNYTAELNAFYKQIEKASQQFVIDPLQDTIIHGKDGSSLLIPANTFGKGPVTIVLKEYYTYEDIITNRLSTLSGGLPLITGGMIHITAMVDGKEVNMQPDKAIKWFIPDTSAAMKQMQLFTGVQQTKPLNSVLKVNGDSTGDWSYLLVNSPGNYNELDWIPQQQLFTDRSFTTKVKVLDLRDAPMSTRDTKNGKVAIFRMSDHPKKSKAELAALLKQKYPGYYKIKLRSPARLMVAKPESDMQMNLIADGVGDSIWITVREARQYRLTATDTITTLTKQISYEFGPRSRNINTLTTSKLTDLAARYSVDLRTLGWVNCDRFLNDGRPKIPFFVDLQDTASNYYTMLVFYEVKSMMAGAVNGKKVLFNNIPEGIKAKIICVGIKDGKPVSASEDLVVSTTPFKDLKFEETSPDAFKKEAGMLDKE